LEVSQPGLILEFESDSLISVAGAKTRISVNSIPEPNSGLIRVQKGDRVKLEQVESGSRVYIGIRSGFQTDEVLGSRSYFGPVTPKSMVETGDRLPFAPEASRNWPVHSKPRWKTDWFEHAELEVFPGPDWNLLLPEQRSVILEQPFHLSHLCSRMGFQLTEEVENRLPELPTNPVFPGTVQLTPGGKLLILMRDAGVTGGYPRILQLREDSLSVLSQKKSGEPIQFRLHDF
jgi:allophanate hydrolase subunit 2